MLSQVSIYNLVRMTPPLGLSSFDLESLGTTEVQIFLMAATSEQAVNSGTATTTSMGEQLFLCSL